MMTNTIMARCLALGIGRVFVIAVPGTTRSSRARPRRAPARYRLGRFTVGDQRLGRPQPGRAPREKVAYLVALHASMMGDEGLERAGALAARHRDPGGVAQAHEENMDARESMLQRVLLARASVEADAGAVEDRGDVAAISRGASASSAARAPTHICLTGRRISPRQSR